MLYTITVVSSCCLFIGKSFLYISCLSLHGLHEESILGIPKNVECEQGEQGEGIRVSLITPTYCDKVAHLPN